MLEKIIQENFKNKNSTKIDRSNFINLSNNYLAHPNVTEIMDEFFKELNKSLISNYPYYEDTRERLKIFFKFSLNVDISLSSGTDSAIYYLMILAKELNLNKIFIQEHNYYAYYNYAKILDLNYMNISREEICSINSYKILENIEPTFIFLVSPSCLTGLEIDFHTIRKFIIHAEKQGHFIFLDQAYAFFGTDLYLDLLKEFKNLTIIYTFSKAYASAGMRIGCIMSKNNLINRLREMGLENSVSSISLCYLDFITKNNLDFKKYREDIILWRNSTRNELIELLTNKHINIFDSKANFISIDFKNKNVVDNIIDMCKNNHGIFIKSIFNYNGLFRCTITEPKIMRKIIIEIENGIEKCL